MNNVNIMGRITNDLELRYTQSSKTVTSFSIAINRGSKDGKTEADFIDCVAWGLTAEFITKYFSKGRLIALNGELRTRTYTDKNGSKRKAVEVLVTRAYFTGEKDNHQQPMQQQPTQQQAQQPMQQQPTQQQAQQPWYNFSDYEDILSDGEAPF